MIVDARQYPNEDTLNALGAQIIVEVLDGNGALVSYNVTPDIDLTQYEATDAQTVKQQLIYYAQNKQAAKLRAGTDVNIGPRSVHVATDPASLAGIATLGASAAKNPGAMFMWITDDGSAISINATQATHISTSTSTFVQSTYTTLGLAIDKINSGAITMESQIDVMFT